MSNALEFPISIALIGAPDSGKSEVAEKFAEVSADWFKENGSEFRILVNPGNILQGKYDVAMGLFGGYFEDLRAYFLEYEQEEQARRDGVSFMGLSTAFTNLAHAGVNLEHVLTGLQTQETQKLATQGQISMSALTFFFMEKFRFSFGFYIPTPGSSLVLPGGNEDSFGQRVDMALRQIFANFGMRIQVLDEPTIEEKVESMFETVKRIVADGPDGPPEDAVDTIDIELAPIESPSPPIS